MNALNIKSAIIVVAALLVGSTLLHAVSPDEVPVSAEGGQTDVEPQEAVEKKTEVNEPEAKPELTSEEWMFVIVTVKANWLDNPDIVTIRKEIQSGCTALQYRQLEELNSDPLNFGPSLAFGRPGYVASFESVSELDDQIAWLKSHGLLIGLTSSRKISDGALVDIPLIEELMSARESTNPFWEVRLFQDRVTADYIDAPFKRLQISRELKNDLADSGQNRKGSVDITKLEIGSEIAGIPPEAFTLHFFPLNRDEVIREQLASVSDAVAFFIVYPGNAEFNQGLKDAAAGNTKVFQYRYKFGDHTMGVHERSTPVHGWEVTSNVGENIVDLGADLCETEAGGSSADGPTSKTPQNSAAGGGFGSATKQPDKAMLRKQVEQAFDVRQHLQELEAEKLRLKLQLIEANLTTRQKNRDGIIERRVKELLTSGIDDSSKPKKKDPAKSRIELLVFGAGYAEAIHKMKPIVKSMIDDGLPVRIVDITTEKEQARRFKIISIPTIVVTTDGQESRRFIGPQTEAELRREIRISTRELESQTETTSPVGFPGAPRLPAGIAEAARPFQKDSTQTAATPPANAQDSAVAMKWKQPSEIISELRKAQAVIEELQRTRADYDVKLRELSEKKKGESPGSSEYRRIEFTVQMHEKYLATLPPDTDLKKAIGDWCQAWSEYQSQLRLLRLDVESAKASLAPLIQVRDLRKRLVEKGVFSEIDFAQTESEVQLAEIQLRRAEELLKLYADIEKNEPQLNPDYQAPPAEAVPDAKPEQ